MCKTNILYIDNSEIEGKGLFANSDLDVGECVGLLARVLGDSNFNDKPFGRYINHSENPNLDLNNFLISRVNCSKTTVSKKDVPDEIWNKYCKRSKYWMYSLKQKK